MRVFDVENFCFVLCFLFLFRYVLIFFISRNHFLTFCVRRFTLTHTFVDRLVSADRGIRSITIQNSTQIKYTNKRTFKFARLLFWYLLHETDVKLDSHSFFTDTTTSLSFVSAVAAAAAAMAAATSLRNFRPLLFIDVVFVLLLFPPFGFSFVCCLFACCFFIEFALFWFPHFNVCARSLTLTSFISGIVVFDVFAVIVIVVVAIVATSIPFRCFLLSFSIDSVFTIALPSTNTPTLPAYPNYIHMAYSIQQSNGGRQFQVCRSFCILCAIVTHNSIYFIFI